MYRDWKTKKSYSPQSIKLDRRNPRLHDVPADPKPAELINLLLAQYPKDIQKIAKSIADKGYFPHEDILLIEESGKRIVVEGNCRVCACKILLNPNQIKDQRKKNYYKRLSKKMSDQAFDSFKKIPCSVAPNREQAYILIENRHTSAPINPWTPYAQGNFYRSLLLEGRSIQELADEFNRPASDIRSKIRVTSVSDVIMNLPLASENPEIYTSNVKDIGIAAGIILRLLQSKEAQNHFGLTIEISEEGNLSSSLLDEDFIGVMSSLARDALENKDSKGNPIIDTRVLNDDAGRKEYLSKYNGYMPQGKGSATFNSEDYIDGKDKENNGPSDNKKQPGKPPTTSTKKTTRSDNWLLKRNININSKSEKVRALAEEALEIKWTKSVHTSGLLLRALLECALKARMKEVGIWDDVRRANHGSDLIGIDKLIEQTVNNKSVLNDNELNESFKSDYHHLKGKGRYKRVLDYIQHNDQHRITEDDIKEIRTRLEPLLRHLLETLPISQNNGTDG